MARGTLPWAATGSQFLDVVRREMDDLVGRLQDPSSWNDEVAAFAPRTNVAECDKGYEISIDLPGMKSEEFQIEMHEGRLSVSGERAKEQEEHGKTFHRIERVYGKFRRTFALGQDVDPEHISAKYRDGVLTVKVPKSERAQPRKITVTAT